MHRFVSGLAARRAERVAETLTDAAEELGGRSPPSSETSPRPQHAPTTTRRRCLPSPPAAPRDGPCSPAPTTPPSPGPTARPVMPTPSSWPLGTSPTWTISPRSAPLAQGPAVPPRRDLHHPSGPGPRRPGMVAEPFLREPARRRLRRPPGRLPAHGSDMRFRVRRPARGLRGHVYPLTSWSAASRERSAPPGRRDRRVRRRSWRDFPRYEDAARSGWAGLEPTTGGL